jgi:hypothetical protein
MQMKAFALFDKAKAHTGHITVLNSVAVTCTAVELFRVPL